MNQNIKYSFASKEQRSEDFRKFMERVLSQYIDRVKPQVMELFQSRKALFEESFCKAAGNGINALRPFITSGSKGKLHYFHVSYLLSGALSEEMLLKLDFYDKRYYADLEEIDCFWDYGGLFLQLQTEREQMVRELSQTIIQIKSAEITQVGIGLTACNYMILKPVITELIKGERFMKLITPYCEDGAYFLYGAYLDESEVVHRLLEGGAS